MDLTSTKSTSTSDITHSTSSLSAKMKRLQIEESLLLQSINKCVPEGSQADGGIDATSYLSFSEFKAFLVKTKNSYREMKLIFQDIKTSTSSKEMLKTIDIDDVKNNTLELEKRIKAFKLYLQSELSGLKSAEQQFNRTINENTVLTNKLRKLPRIQTAKYNEIVPSPVKTMMTSPFKCLEAQQFQEFMVNSANRYGGWNEYHHNIFVNHWQKHFGSPIDTSFDEIHNPVENSSAFHLFLHELFPKIQDICEEEIISHVKWYSKYIYLKERQQKAIDKWRSNRKVMKSAKVELGLNKESNKRNGRKKKCNFIDINNTVSGQLDIINDSVPRFPNQDEVLFNSKCYSVDVKQVYTNEDVYSNLTNEENQTPKKDPKEIGDQTLLHYKKLTKQWCNRIDSKNIMNETNMNNLENIKKLRVPAWRVGL